MKKIYISTETINLDQFLKWSGLASTGGEAKLMINQGLVKLNGHVETRRSKKLIPGDVVEVRGEEYEVGKGCEI